MDHNELSISMDTLPLVTILINTKDRPDDLAFTLEDIKRQTYPNVELLIIDDASTPPIGPIVFASWPNARLIRHEVAVNLAGCRNEGTRVALGKYVLQIDDDSSPVAADAIHRAVSYMEADPRSALISFYIWNGKKLPENLDLSAAVPGLCFSFTGAGVMYRRSAILETDGFRYHYLGYGEEEELSAQLLRRGWSQMYQPDIIIHHRFTSLNRSNPSSWKRNVRNRIWTIVSFMPIWRIPIEVGWKLTDATLDAIRLLRFKTYFQALAEIVRGLPLALRLREPLDDLSLRRYDLLRSKFVITREEFENPTAQMWANFMRSIKRWPNRLREGSFWSKKKSVGRGRVPTHEHELEK